MNIRLLKSIDRMVGGIATTCLPSAIARSFPVPRDFLIIRPGGIGDAVLLIPAILALKAKYPDARITVLAEKRNGAIFKLCTVVDKILYYDKPKELLAAIRGQYDVVIDTEQWHRLSAVVARLTRAPVSVGFATNDRKKLFTCPVPYTHDDYEAESFLHLLSPLGVSTDLELPPEFLSIPDKVEGRVSEFLSGLQGKPFVVIFPGASISERRWGADRFAAVACRINEQGLSVVVVGGREDVVDGTRIIERCDGVNLAGKTTLIETAAVIRRAALLVSGDSGILHVGVGLGRPTVSLFGPGISAKWAPRGENHQVLNARLTCSPCTRFGTTPSCPVNAKCLSDISVDEVAASVGNLLKRNKILMCNKNP